MQTCKILFLAADPENFSPLALDEESREIDRKIRAADNRDLVEVITKYAVRPDDLLEYLNRFKPDVLHFSGHGLPGDKVVLINQQRQAHAVTGSSIKQLLLTMKDNIRLVVLNACYSHTLAESITEEIDCAVGMTLQIGDLAAITFAASFYRAIAYGRSVKEAFEQGVVSLTLEGLADADKPRLYVRQGLDPAGVFLVQPDTSLIRNIRPTLQLPLGEATGGPIIASSRLPRTYDTGVFEGRDTEIADLDAAWADPRTRVVALVAVGGAGKSSLAAQWAMRLIEAETRSGPERYFDWSFYRQGVIRSDGANAQVGTSADAFAIEALRFFGDETMATSNASGWQKGERLAELITQHRSLIVLDGIEPLQFAPDREAEAELKDEILKGLLGKLAVYNPGLCLITTREKIRDLIYWRDTSAPQWKLDGLSSSAGAVVLSKLGVTGRRKELEGAVTEVRGHALTLTLMGRYLKMAFRDDPDIARRDCFGFEEADAETQSGHAFRIIAAYQRWLEEGDGIVELSILRLLGLFDRPATPDCLGALACAPPIPMLTDALVDLARTQWSLALTRLENLGLIETLPWSPKTYLGFREQDAREALRNDEEDFGEVTLPEPISVTNSANRAPIRRIVDAHPLVRAYFAASLSDNKSSFNASSIDEDAPSVTAHRRLYNYLCDSVPYWPEGADALEPLYQAVAHGCKSGQFQHACDEVLCNRIFRGTYGPYAFYSSKKLGLTGLDLAAVGCFFTKPWGLPVQQLRSEDRAWVLAVAAFCLRASHRLTEVPEPLRAALIMAEEQKDWKAAAVRCSNLSEVELILGDIAAAKITGDHAVALSDESRDIFQRVVNRTTSADAFHQGGDFGESQRRFDEAEKILAGQKINDPLLHSLWGFRRYDFLLKDIERAAWRAYVRPRSLGTNDETRTNSFRKKPALPDAETILNAMESDCLRGLEMVLNGSLTDKALNELTLGRISLYRGILNTAQLKSSGTTFEKARSFLDIAVDTLRKAGFQHHLPRGLLSRAWLHAAEKEELQSDNLLSEAQVIAERSRMTLHLADVHLHRGRLRADRTELQKARQIIEQAKYFRRLGELEDAEATLSASGLSRDNSE